MPLNKSASFFFLGCLLVANVFPVSAQHKRVKVPSYFGIQVRPIIPVKVFGTGPVAMKGNGIEATVTQSMGFSFGGTVRAGITQLLAIETGISFIRRNYTTKYVYPDSSLTGETKLGVISYDIPLNLLVYVKIKGPVYMNVSMGASATMYPSNVRTEDLHYPHSFVTEGLRKGWVTAALNANIGFEYRTNKSGFFYIGGSFQYPFSPIYTLAAAYNYKNASNVVFGKLGGTYITVDLKYFFPNIRNKGEQFQQGPIEQ